MSADSLFAVAVRNQVADLSDAVVLRGTGRRVYESLRAGVAREDAVSALAEEGQVPREQAEHDVACFLAELRSHGLLDGPIVPIAPIVSIGPIAPRETSVENPDQIPADDGTPTCTEMDGSHLEALARSVLTRGFALRFQARGRSMRPFVPHGSVLEVVPRPFAQAQRGEVVLFATDRERLVAHRVVGVVETSSATTLLARGDSSAQVDEIGEGTYLGVVTARVTPDGRAVPISSGWRRSVGMGTGVLYNALVRFGRRWVIPPLQRSLRGPSRLRRGTLGIFRGVSGLLHLSERAARRVRRRVDVVRAVLLTASDRDRQRERLYERGSIQKFTALDENVSAGLTLLEEFLLSREAIASPGRALVLGCGPGRECFALAERGFEVTGLDRSRGMLDRARAGATRRGLDVRFILGEASDTSIDGGPFDVVVIFSGLYNMVMPRSRRVALLRAAHGNLRPGGRVLITFLSAYVAPGVPPPVEGRTLGEAINSEHEDGDFFLLNEVVHIFPRGDDVAAEGRAAGFIVDTVYRDQRAYDRAEGQVRGYAVLRRPQ